MRELFEIPELVRIAVQDEKSGVVFYSALAKTIRKPELQKIFAGLAEQEKFHQKRYELMLAGMNNYQPREEYPGQYMEYLRTLTSTRAFPDEATAARKAAECKDDAAAVELSTRFERDTLMLINEMRGLLEDKDRAVIDDIAREEQAHLVALTDARRKLQE